MQHGVAGPLHAAVDMAISVQTAMAAEDGMGCLGGWRFRALDTLREAAILGGASFVGVTAAIFCCSQKFCFVAPGRIAP
jgi:hypothetical protein